MIAAEWLTWSENYWLHGFPDLFSGVEVLIDVVYGIPPACFFGAVLRLIAKKIQKHHLSRTSRPGDVMAHSRFRCARLQVAKFMLLLELNGITLKAGSQVQNKISNTLLYHVVRPVDFP